MTSQIKYNTNLQIFLTQMLIYLIDNKKVTREEFNELLETPSSKFSKYMKTFKQMLYDLHLDFTLLEEDYKENIESNGQFKTKHYYITLTDNPYKFEYTNLTEEQLITYSMTIVYLMLKNHQYVTTTILIDAFPNFNKKTMANLKEKLSLIIADDIDKNELQSYILISDDF